MAPDETQQLRGEVNSLRNEVARVHGGIVAIDSHLKRNEQRLENLDGKLDRVLAGQSAEGVVRETADHDHTAQLKAHDEQLKQHTKILNASSSWRDRIVWTYAGICTGAAALVTVLHFLGKL